MDTLSEWIDRQARRSATQMLGAVSATDRVMERRGFAQRIVPQPGSVLASPVSAHYDPDPDYFFHWFRDAAAVMDALQVAHLHGYLGEEAPARLAECVAFTSALRTLDGAALVSTPAWCEHVAADFQQHLRPQAELRALSGDAVMADVRVNADGSLDISRWSRPQTDGTALRCLVLLRWLARPAPDSAERAAAAALLEADLACALANAQLPAVDIWEEETGYHYYTLLVHATALEQGAPWLEARDAPARAASCRDTARQLLQQLESFWNHARGCFRSRVGISGGDPQKELDMAVILATLHTARVLPPHGVLDLRVQATLTALEQLFEDEYPINQQRPAGVGPAMGRYANDRYYSGGAYYFSTLGAAEFYYRLAAALRGGADLPLAAENERFRERLRAGDSGAQPDWAALALQRGDALMAAVRRYTPADGQLAEQFDQRSGAPASAKRLSWSYAAFITAAAARTAASRATPA